MPSPESIDDEHVRALLARGRRLHRDGDLASAMDCYRRILASRVDHADALYLYALALYRQGQVEDALACARRAVAADPDNALARASLGQMLQDAGRDADAVSHLRHAAALRGDNPVVLNALGLSLMRTGDTAAADAAFERAVELAPDGVEARLNRANLHRLQGRLDAARAGYQRCLALVPGHAEAHNNLGVLYQQRCRPTEAARHFEAAIASRDDYAEAHNNLGAALNDLGHAPRALACFRRAAALAPGFVEARVNAGVTLQLAGHHEAARAVLDEAARRVPDDPAVAWSRCMAALASVYPTDAELTQARADYARRLESLAAQIKGGAAPGAIDRCIGLVQPFLLAYQGEDDRALQSAYGDLVCAGAPCATPAAGSGRVRVGIVSGFFHEHSNWKVPISGWLPHLADAFELHGYYTGHKEDACTAQARQWCHRFHAGLSAAELAAAIEAGGIDVLIYPEVGMNPATTRLAARRLAPVQCASWGHPVTTGFPTMDYFLSSELMEPPDGDAHYRERLVRLPGLSFACEAPENADADAAGRHDFGLGESDTVYLCVQNLSKYLPRHDRLLAAIAARVETARFVFIAGAPGATGELKRRLRSAFGAHVYRRCVRFLERLPRGRFLALQRIADAGLDPPGWSGCNSTLDAFAADLPVVTLPGCFLRGRHTLAFYRRMNHDALIARDEAHYVALAVRLGLDAGWRADQRRIIGERKHALYGDDAPARALVSFIEGTARDARRA